MKADLPTSNQSTRFLLLYALAWAGGSISYVPFLSILLPVRVSAVVPDQSVEWLAHIAFIGAVAASLGNIGFGWLSDRTGNRRTLIVAGVAASSILLVTMPIDGGYYRLLAQIVAWQLSLNLMLAPLSAWAGDCIPHHQKGTLGGLIAFAPAVGALSGAFVTLPGLASGDGRLWLVAVLVPLCVLPAVLFGRPRPFPELMYSDAPEVPLRQAITGLVHSAVGRMWIARLLIQIAEAALFAFLYIWLRTLDDSITDNDTARLFSIVLSGSIPIAFLAGHWSDRTGRPALPLTIGTALSATGLVVMGLAGSIPIAITGYFIFGLASTAFLSLHSAQTLRFLSRPEHRARDLGLFNLTNTVPSMVMPWLTLAMVPIFGFGALFFLLAGLAVVSGALLLSLLRQD
ncbi:MFS transporter [Altererythrobacter salegens]|uniref:MFS transporter n=1 Tax=Croceibacterium salegens TaxID=1737568 RepID=A0A6I4SWR1_9SPHN|nr:MFS transporter [Croceibacterium salegens]MXO59477.1 MFS transporter [Croceibacterium salegens]